MVQRRLHRRAPKQILIKCKNETLFVEGVSLDICPGGVFIITDHLPPCNSIVDVELWLDEDSPVYCSGQVIWVNRGQVIHYPQGFGVQFTQLANVQLESILQLYSDKDQDMGAIPW